jgi:phosphatidylserine/phosphatidylglycerophosphate/cardiolipin synthase-like enzyme
METIVGKEFHKKVIPLIDNAKRSIKIVVFDWRWYPNLPENPVQLFNQSLVRASRRGVNVSALCNSDDITDTLKSVGISAKRYKGSRLLHTKLIIIDEEILIIGSHNYTASAMQHNLELSISLKAPSGLERIIAYFNNLYNI